MAIESGDEVHVDYVGRRSDGTVFDTSLRSVLDEPDAPKDASPPLSIEIGAERIVRGPGRIIEALEDPLVGMDEGDSETVTVDPEQAYGLAPDENVVTYDRELIGQMMGDGVNADEPREGLTVRTGEGQVGEIVDVRSREVRVDFNHQLAGETLTFELTVRKVE